MVNDLEQFGYMYILDPWPFEKFNMHKKSAYRITSHRRSLGTVGTDSVTDTRGNMDLTKTDYIHKLTLYMKTENILHVEAEKLSPGSRSREEYT